MLSGRHRRPTCDESLGIRCALCGRGEVQMSTIDAGVGQLAEERMVQGGKSTESNGSLYEREMCRCSLYDWRDLPLNTNHCPCSRRGRSAVIARLCGRSVAGCVLLAIAVAGRRLLLAKSRLRGGVLHDHTTPRLQKWTETVAMEETLQGGIYGYPPHSGSHTPRTRGRPR